MDNLDHILKTPEEVLEIITGQFPQGAPAGLLEHRIDSLAGCPPLPLLDKKDTLMRYIPGTVRDYYCALSGEYIRTETTEGRFVPFRL